MVYRKRMYRGRRKVVKKSSGWAGTAMKALKVANYVRSLINVEKKFFDVTQQINYTATGTVYPLTQIAQGDAYNQRNGNSLKIKSLFLRFQNQLNPVQSNDVVRVMLFIDTQNNGNTPLVTDVLQNAGIISPINYLNGSRFRVIMDKIQPLTNDGNEIKEIKLFKKFNYDIKYSGSGSANTREGNIYMLCISQNSTNFSFGGYWSRIRYVDN